MFGNNMFGGNDALDQALPRSTLRRLGQAGRGYLSQNFDSQFPSLSADRAQEFQSAMQEGYEAMNAPYGSLAARNNPFRYGSLASRKFPEIFGREGQKRFDAAQKMQRRSPFGGYDDGYGSGS